MILAEIDALTRATPNNMSPDRCGIASLKQEYNEIVLRGRVWYGAKKIRLDVWSSGRRRKQNKA